MFVVLAIVLKVHCLSVYCDYRVYMAEMNLPDMV